MKRKVICIIMGGGRGTRLHPLTEERCKPAVPLAGKYRLVDIPISNCLNSGYNQIHILTQFNTASLHNHIQGAYQFDPFGGGFCEILSAEQTLGGDTWYQGTADAVRQNLHHFRADDQDIYLLLSGDQLYSMDFSKVVRHHLDNEADVTISAKPVHKSEAGSLGVMRVEDDFSIKEFVEKPSDPAVVESLLLEEKLHKFVQSGQPEEMCLASMGIYAFTARVMREALDNNMTDFGKEVIPALLGQRKLISYIFDGYWEDIGTVGAFFEANLALTDHVPPFNFFDGDAPVYTRARFLPASKINECQLDHVILAGGAIVSNSRLSRTVVGVRSFIRDGCTLENVVMMGADWFENTESRQKNRDMQRPDVGMGKNCRIRNAIIDKNARIGDDVDLSPDGKPDLWREGDVMVRDGVVVVMKNGVVPNGTKL